jgi:glycerophosphoryl diester phosphodiesterase
MSRPRICAHRGFSARALENSLEAFRLALAVPVDMIEFDLRKSRDNDLYVLHDRHTGRTCDRNIDIERSTEEEIGRLKLRNGESVPRLRDVLDFIRGRTALNIEIKSEGAGALCAAQLTGAGYRGEVLISSFHEAEVAAAKSILPDAPVSVIYDSFGTDQVGPYARNGYRVISLKRSAVTAELVALLHDMNIRVYVWTVEKVEEMRVFASWGVDGIYSNDPALLRRAVSKESE